ncbi:hypothetical protein QVD99_002121 [Batrachochytrium dendrobatidis]|nr:hypothetical protein O5D80_005819 [Batrachochytrium dendrobatidis]KAK5671408.1 hypothetical protein QVD99_002121 [Batrachochytrium dendrobatidis]
MGSSKTASSHSSTSDTTHSIATALDSAEKLSLRSGSMVSRLPILVDASSPLPVRTKTVHATASNQAFDHASTITSNASQASSAYPSPKLPAGRRFRVIGRKVIEPAVPSQSTDTGGSVNVLDSVSLSKETTALRAAMEWNHAHMDDSNMSDLTNKLHSGLHCNHPDLVVSFTDLELRTNQALASSTRVVQEAEASKHSQSSILHSQIMPQSTRKAESVTKSSLSTDPEDILASIRRRYGIKDSIDTSILDNFETKSMYNYASSHNELSFYTAPNLTTNSVCSNLKAGFQHSDALAGIDKREITSTRPDSLQIHHTVPFPRSAWEKHTPSITSNTHIPSTTPSCTLNHNTSDLEATTFPLSLFTSDLLTKAQIPAHGAFQSKLVSVPAKPFDAFEAIVAQTNPSLSQVQNGNMNDTQSLTRHPVAVGAVGTTISVLNQPCHDRCEEKESRSPKLTLDQLGSIHVTDEMRNMAVHPNTCNDPSQSLLDTRQDVILKDIESRNVMELDFQAKSSLVNDSRLNIPQSSNAPNSMPAVNESSASPRCLDTPTEGIHSTIISALAIPIAVDPATKPLMFDAMTYTENLICTIDEGSQTHSYMQTTHDQCIGTDHILTQRDAFTCTKVDFTNVATQTLQDLEIQSTNHHDHTKMNTTLDMDDIMYKACLDDPIVNQLKQRIFQIRLEISDIDNEIEYLQSLE